MFEGTKVVPYKALFGIKPKIGLKTLVSSELLVTIKIGIEEEILINLLKDELIDYSGTVKIQKKVSIYKTMIILKYNVEICIFQRIF